MATLSASLAFAEDFQTINGKEYKNVTVSRVEPDGIVLKSESGISKVYFTELPKDVQARFHYHSAQAATAAQQNAAFAEHPLGATADQFVARYGAPQDSPSLDKNFPVLNGAIHHTYEYQGWRIRAAFLPADGRAVRMDYSKSIKGGVDPKIQDYELQAIMTANTQASMGAREGTPFHGLFYGLRNFWCKTAQSCATRSERACVCSAVKNTLCNVLKNCAKTLL